jgi:transposase
MKRFIECESRTQTSLFPECLDDYVGEDNSVRVVEAFIDGLDLGKLGFTGVNPHDTGRPAYHPCVMLKIYVYGYLNRIHSSRRLERETGRNVELMWLTGRLTPDFKTIANFRKDNGKAIRKVCREFVALCRKLGLLSQALVAIDGSKFKADNNRDRNLKPSKLARRLEEIERSIERYFYRLDKADQKEPAVAEIQTANLKDKIESLKEEMERTKRLEAELLKTPEKQISLTDPDARSLRTRGTGIVGYNVQTAVDAEHHLIVAHDVTNKYSDRGQLFSMAQQAQAAMDVEELEVVADRGYFKNVEILACHEAGIAAIVPRPQTSNNKALGLFDRQDFHYIPEDDEYRCPAGERLPKRTTMHQNGMTLYRYWSSNCQSCSLKSKCTTGKERRVSRWEHEEVLDAMQDRLDRHPEKMRARRDTVEHPFGTLKRWMGSEHFLTRTMEHVSTEMSLHVLAYNLKRVMNMVGIEALIGAIRAFFMAVMRVLRRRYSASGSYWALAN